MSLTINLTYQDWRHIKGLSRSALAQIVDDAPGIAAAKARLLKCFPQSAEWGAAPMAEEMAVLKITRR